MNKPKGVFDNALPLAIVSCDLTTVEVEAIEESNVWVDAWNSSAIGGVDGFSCVQKSNSIACVGCLKFKLLDEFKKDASECGNVWCPCVSLFFIMLSAVVLLYFMISVIQLVIFVPLCVLFLYVVRWNRCVTGDEEDVCMRLCGILTYGLSILIWIALFIYLMTLIHSNS